MCIWEPEPRRFIAISADPVLWGGHVGADHVGENYVAIARVFIDNSEAQRHWNEVQLGQALKWAANRIAPPAVMNPGIEREKLRRQINRHVRRLAMEVYDKEWARAYYEEIEVPFHASFSVIISTWGVDQLRQVADRLERRILEALRHG